MLGIDPLTESEMIEFTKPVLTQLGFDANKKQYVTWICTCGKKCAVSTQAVEQGTEGGYCKCGRAWLIQPNKLYVELAFSPMKYSFPIIKDDGASWRFFRRPSVGLP